MAASRIQTSLEKAAQHLSERSELSEKWTSKNRVGMPLLQAFSLLKTS